MTNLNKPTATLPEMTVKLTDGAEHTVRPSIGDMAKYDVLRARKGWPKREDAEMLFITVLIYLALRRTGRYSGDVDTFIEAADELDIPDEFFEDADEAEDDARL